MDNPSLLESRTQSSCCGNSTAYARRRMAKICGKSSRPGKWAGGLAYDRNGCHSSKKLGRVGERHSKFNQTYEYNIKLQFLYLWSIPVVSGHCGIVEWPANQPIQTLLMVWWPWITDCLGNQIPTDQGLKWHCLQDPNWLHVWNMGCDHKPALVLSPWSQLPG